MLTLILPGRDRGLWMAQSFWLISFTPTCSPGTALPVRINGWNSNIDLASPLPANIMRFVETKSCSSCGERFGCGPESSEGTCWCDHMPAASFVGKEDRDCLCPKCLHQAIQESGGACSSTANSVQPLRQAVVNTQYSLVEGEDYYSEGEMIIFTARYHLRRGYCCKNGCRHCPYRENGR